MLTVSFKHYECQKRQCQNDPVFIPPLSSSLHFSIRHQQSLCHFCLHPSRKKPLSSSIGHPCAAFTNSICDQATAVSDSFVSSSHITCRSNLIFIASVVLSLNDFDASLLHYKVEVRSPFMSAPSVSPSDLQLHSLFPFLPFFHHV